MTSCHHLITHTHTHTHSSQQSPSDKLRWHYTKHSYLQWETQLLPTNRATRLEVNQRHQTWWHSIC